MEKILQNYGLSHIVIKIFGYLDYKSLCKARLTSQSWKDFIDTYCKPNRVQWKLTVTFHSKQWFLELWPEWKNILSDFIQNRSSNDVKKLLDIVNYYFNQYPHILNLLDPLMMAIELKNDFNQVKLILPSVQNLNYQNRDGRTILHKAITYGRLEMVQWLLEHERHRIDLEIQDRYGRTTLEEATIQYLARDQADRKTIFELISGLQSTPDIENNSG